MIAYDFDSTLTESVEKISDFYIFKNSEKCIVDNKSIKFDIMKQKIKTIFENGRVMPAFGVSLDRETQNALSEGTWLQLNFNEEKEINGLPFNALLFKLETASGFNLIRFYDGKYEGRCIYFDCDDILDLKQIFNIS